MKRFKIKNLVNGMEFQLDAEVLKLQPEYGKAAYDFQQLVTPAVIDEQGVEISPAVYQTVSVPAEHVITEATAELVAEKAAKDAKAAAINAAKATKGKKRTDDEINALLDLLSDKL